MTMNQSFSVIIPLYNKGNYIRRALDSVLSQTYQDFEIIVVNDGSDDGGDAVVRSYLDKRIQLIDQANSGVSIARNTGVAASHTDFICMLDADDEWKPHFLEDMKSLLDEFPNHHIFSLRHEIVCTNGKLINPTVSLPNGHRGIVENFIDTFAHSNGLINASSVCLRKSYFLTLGGFPNGESQGEDLYLWLLYALKTDIIFYDRIASCYYKDSSNRSIHRVCKKELPYHFSHFYSLLKQKQFSKRYGKEKTSPLRRYLRNQAVLHTAALIALDKRDIALAHSLRLFRLNKYTCFDCLLIQLFPSKLLGKVQIARNYKRAPQ